MALIAIFTTISSSVGTARTATSLPPNQCQDLFGTSGKVGSPKFESASESVLRQLLAQADVEINGSRDFDIQTQDQRVFDRILSDPDLQFGETYVDGLWNSKAIDQMTTRLLTVHMNRGMKAFAPLLQTPILALRAFFNDRYRFYRDLFTNRQTRERSKTVAEQHYDAGNDLYRQMLDPTMTYTSGVWGKGFTLEDAQNAKYDLIARKLKIKSGQRILDIGSGFGGFARFAAKHYGARVTGITISVEQLKAARALSIDTPGVEFIFSDYRDLPHRFAPDTFDHVVSIEMIEAVGVKNLKAYFQSANSVLKDGGRFLIQAIASNADVVNSNAWFSKYIFQDGVAPSVDQVNRAANGTFGPAVDRHRITGHYDLTLMAWHKNFTQAWPALESRYGDRFKRMWDFYLLSVAGGFRSGILQLDQAVYVKGSAHRDDVESIRTLPTLETLIAMRATPEQKRRTQLAVIELEIKSQESKMRVEGRARLASGPEAIPLHRSARIAVVGAGPAGLSSARELQKLGYDNVVIFEKSDVAGGKSHTIDFGGRPHDMGATMGVRLKYSAVERLAKEAGEETVPFPKEVHYDLAKGTVADSSHRQNLRNAYEAVVYLINYLRTVGLGSRRLETPPLEFSDPWSVVMSRQGLNTFGSTMNTYLTGYGYGDSQTPAVFAHRMLDPNAVLGAALSSPIMWRNGTQPIWKNLASKLNVRFGHSVERITRKSDGIDLHIQVNQGTVKVEKFDRVVMAVDPTTTLKILDATREETQLFSMVQYTPYATFAVRVEGFSEGRAEVGYLRENMTTDREGSPMAWIKRYPDDDLFVFHLFAPRRLSDDQIMTNIERDLRRLGARKVTLVDSRRWPFFPHVDAIAMREENFYERAAALQGQNGTVFVNEALAMSTMPDAVELGRKVAQRLASGEYAP